MSEVEVEAKTMEEALEKASQELGASKEELEIEVLEEGAGKVFGLLGGKNVKIRATVLRAPEKGKGEAAKEVLETILSYLASDFTVNTHEDDEKIVLDIRGDGSGLLIGRRGQTLDALQYLVNKIVNRFPEDRKQVVVDTESYRVRRKDSLVTLARRLSEKAKRQNAPVTTNPLSSSDRRIIHLALQDEEELETKSKGEGLFRRVVIFPKGFEHDSGREL
jgi:spoIIIJ-associated protein